MKKSIAYALCALLLPICMGRVFASEISTDSKLTAVTVYQSQALLTRVATLKVDRGEYTVVFPNIIPDVDENSLKISAGGNAEVRLFGAQVKKEFLQEESSEKIKALQDSIQQVEDQISQANDTRSLLADEKNYLDSVRLFSAGQIPKDLVTRMPPAKDLDDTLKFLDTRLKENYAQVSQTEQQVRELNKKLDALRRELAQIQGPGRKLKRSIMVDMEVIKPGNVDLSVSYLVNGASWQPIYDARAQFEKQQVELVSYGVVKQATGEDWQDVAMSLSTAKPAIGGRMPEVAPWFLRVFQPPKPMVMTRNAGMMMKSMKADYLESEVQGVVEEAAPVPYSVAEEKGVAVVYALAKKATVNADGSDHKLPISSQILKADFQYSTFPRAVPSCFLRSTVTNAKDLQLLSGRVNIFLEGDFVGVSSIDTIGPGEEFDLYLGLDENVKVKRELVEQKMDDVWIANIPSPNRKTTFKYKLTVENYKSKKIKLVLFESMPISEDERIKVKLDKVSLEPKDKDWKDKKGVWRWELELEPKAKQEIFESFSVEHPRDLRVEGL